MAADAATWIGAGALGALALLIVYLVASNRRDRVTGRELVGGADTRYAAEVARHDATQEKLDAERAARRAAEDDAAQLRREVADLRARLAHSDVLAAPDGTGGLP